MCPFVRKWWKDNSDIVNERNDRNNLIYNNNWCGSYKIVIFLIMRVLIKMIMLIIWIMKVTHNWLASKYIKLIAQEKRFSINLVAKIKSCAY